MLNSLREMSRSLQLSECLFSMVSQPNKKAQAIHFVIVNRRYITLQIFGWQIYIYIYACMRIKI